MRWFSTWNPSILDVSGSVELCESVIVENADLSHNPDCREPEASGEGEEGVVGPVEGVIIRRELELAPIPELSERESDEPVYLRIEEQHEPKILREEDEIFLDPEDMALHILPTSPVRKAGFMEEYAIVAENEDVGPENLGGLGEYVAIARIRQRLNPPWVSREQELGKPYWDAQGRHFRPIYSQEVDEQTLDPNQWIYRRDPWYYVVTEPSVHMCAEANASSSREDGTSGWNPGGSIMLRQEVEGSLEGEGTA